ncbi:MAG: hypothetical protein H0T99_09465, partial [Geodermatophilaceae bacterium]|nr:hypothetical protein [Geodermatophilaceae bacterium]
QDQITHAYRGLLRQHHPDTRDLTATAQAAASDAVLQHVSLTPVAVEPLWSLTRTLGLMPMSTGRGR